MSLSARRTYARLLTASLSYERASAHISSVGTTKAVSQSQVLWSCDDPRHVLLIGYIFCSQTSDAPRMNKGVAMANRYWALLRITGCPTVDPSIKYEFSELVRQGFLRRFIHNF